MKKYSSFTGTVTMIQDYLVGSDEELKGCHKIISLLREDGSIINFVISQTTYFLDYCVDNIPVIPYDKGPINKLTWVKTIGSFCLLKVSLHLDEVTGNQKPF